MAIAVMSAEGGLVLTGLVHIAVVTDACSMNVAEPLHFYGIL